MSNGSPAAPIENATLALEALSALHRLSAALNRMGGAADASLSAVLCLIVAGAVQLVSGASARMVLYAAPSGGVSSAPELTGGAALPSTTGGVARRIMRLPLSVSGQPLGALHVYRNDERVFSQAERLLLEILVSHAAMALSQARWFAEVRPFAVESESLLFDPQDAGLFAGTLCPHPDGMTLLADGALGAGTVHARCPRLATAPRATEMWVPDLCQARYAEQAGGSVRSEARCAEDAGGSVLGEAHCAEQAGGSVLDEAHCAERAGSSELLASGRRELDLLTGREREVLALLAEGMTNKQIATVLVITPNTVKRHLKAIFEKLGIRTRSAAVAKALSARSPAF